jgi:hypothetical protein
MPPTLELALIVTLAALLSIVSALAGALWWRQRSLPLVRAAHLARDLAERQRVLEELVERLERMGKRGRDAASVSPALPGGPLGRAPTLRVDPAQPSAITGPTLIAVPDLAAPVPPSPPAEAGAELASRFGAIWELADRGASAEAIARSTGHPIGQVELILGLRRQLAASTEGRT